MQSNLKVVESFLEAWRGGDVERVMLHFSPNAAFLPSAAAESSKTYVGHGAIRAVVTAMLEAAASSQFSVTGIWGEGADYFVTWVVSPKDATSNTSGVVGIDHFFVKDGKIDVKDAYRKVVM